MQQASEYWAECSTYPQIRQGSANVLHMILVTSLVRWATEFPLEILTLRELEECAFAIIETRPFLPGLRSLVIHFELDSDIYDDCDAELQRATKLINDTFSGVEEVLCLKESRCLRVPSLTKLLLGEKGVGEQGVHSQSRNTRC